MINIRQIIDSFPVPLDEDGSIGKPVLDQVADNAVSFFDSLPAYYKKTFQPLDQISPSGYGTIVFDWYHQKSFVSVEIGLTKVGFFSEMPDGSSPLCQGVLIDDKITSKIISLLDTLYSRTSDSRK